MGQNESRAGDLFGLMGYLLRHKKILRNRNAGITHLILFWGLITPLLVVILAQFDFTIPQIPAKLLSLFMDILGIAILAGTLFFLIRRIKSTGPEVPQRAILPLIVLLVILLTGFLAEGTRLSIVHPEFTWSSPVGWILSIGLPNSSLFMQLMIRCHFFAVLVFIAILPFTFMRHLASATLNVYYRKKGPLGELKQVSLEEGPIGANAVWDFSWKQLLDAEACVSCGRCDENCPATVSGKPLAPRKVIRKIQEQMEELNRNGLKPRRYPFSFLEDRISRDEIWSCTTCMACVDHCPVFIDPMDKIIDMRRHQVMGRGLLPIEARPLIRNLEIYGDVQGKGIAYRGDWAFNRDVPIVSVRGLNTEVLLWVGCSGSFHPVYQETTRAMVKILKAGGVRFGILAKDELCCGDPARRMGEESLFLELARKNFSRFKQYNVQKIVTLCPHCFNTLKNEYPSLMDNSTSGSRSSFEVIHATEFVMTLIEEKRILSKYPISKTITIQDPCYLGRINHIYDPLREIINFVSGLKFKELSRSRENGFCCGGGGGRMWLHENLGRRISQIRAAEISETGVDLLGTACPYCQSMLDDGIKSLEIEKPPNVLDIIEIVASSLG
jgi:Fe-S oxidoreductase/nitrate reductase gamma subunit